jgi:hypothetical protein
MILVQIITAVITGVLAAIVTVYLTPKVQHYFWKAQRLADLQFATVTEVNRLMAQYLAGHIARDTGADPSWKPPREFFVALHAAAAQVKVLFSDKAWTAFKGVEVLLTATGGLGHAGDSKTDQDFIEAHNKAMHTFYEEIGLPLATDG